MILTINTQENNCQQIWPFNPNLFATGRVIFMNIEYTIMSEKKSLFVKISPPPNNSVKQKFPFSLIFYNCIFGSLLNIQIDCIFGRIKKFRYKYVDELSQCMAYYMLWNLKMILVLGVQNKYTNKTQTNWENMTVLVVCYKVS